MIIVESGETEALNKAINMLRHEVNPDYATAPYRVAFMIGVPIPAAVKLWSRKRRRKWLRQAMRPYAMKSWLPGMLPNPELDNFDELQYHHVNDN